MATTGLRDALIGRWLRSLHYASSRAVHAAPFAPRGVIETDSNQDLPEGIPAQLLKRFLLILSDRIFDSTVDRGIPSIAAAPDGPNTRPSLSRRADSIISFSREASF